MIRKRALVLMVLLVITRALFAATQHAPQPMSWPVRNYLVVETINIRTSRLTLIDLFRSWGNVWFFRRYALEDVVRMSAPDILALQEATESQIDWITRNIPGYEVLDAGPAYQTREQPVLLVRKDQVKVIKLDREWLSLAPQIPDSVSWGNEKPRSFIGAEIQVGFVRQRFAVASVHLDPQSPESRCQSIQYLSEWVMGQDCPVIVMGDFNEPADSPVLDALRAKGRTEPRSPSTLVDSYSVFGRKEQGTLNGYSDKDDKRIDLILVSNEWAVLDSQVMQYRRGSLYVSDHYPVIAMLKLREAPLVAQSH